MIYRDDHQFKVGLCLGILLGFFLVPVLVVISRLLLGIDLWEIKSILSVQRNSEISINGQRNYNSSYRLVEKLPMEVLLLSTKTSTNFSDPAKIVRNFASLPNQKLQQQAAPVRQIFRNRNDAETLIPQFIALDKHEHKTISPVATQETAVVSEKSSTFDAVASRVSRTLCKFKYGKRTFLPESARRLPPMLYTFPGSGNTWSRLLIEYSTGVLTGSVYNDQSLLGELPGEFTCSWTVSAVKVHPHTHNFEDLRVGKFGSDNNKCNRGNVKRFERAILLLRNPFDSIWSEYQRRITQSHVSGIPKSGFDWHRWQANAASLANMYHQMWTVQHAGIERHFKPADYLYVKYELLKDPDSRRGELRKILDFLRITPRRETDPYSKGAVTEEMLECAFLLAESKRAHRTAATLAYKPTAEGQLLALDRRQQQFMTKELAYTPQLVCRMWTLFGKFAARHGYEPYNSINCSALPPRHREPIRMVNVGPQGEYNQRWVAPGAPLIDFGGYNKSDYLAGPGAGGPGGPGPGFGGPGGMGAGRNRRRKRLGQGQGLGAGLGQRPLGQSLKEAGTAGLSSSNTGQASGQGGATRAQGGGGVGELRAVWKEEPPDGTA